METEYTLLEITKHMLKYRDDWDFASHLVGPDYGKYQFSSIEVIYGDMFGSQFTELLEFGLEI